MQFQAAYKGVNIFRAAGQAVCEASGVVDVHQRVDAAYAFALLYAFEQGFYAAAHAFFGFELLIGFPPHGNGGVLA